MLLPEPLDPPGRSSAWLHIQTNPLEDQLVRVIAEGDILHDDVPPSPGAGGTASGFSATGRLRVEAPRRCAPAQQSALDDVVHLHHAHDRSVLTRAR